MTYWVYNFFLTLVFILALPILPLLFFLGTRFREGFLQRIGFYSREVRESIRGSRPIWIHAVSVGEVLSARHLAAQLKERFPERKILLSTFTSAGHKMARQAVAAGDAVIFLPLDHPWMVRRALSVFDPSLLVLLETEIWPNLLRLAHRRGIPTVLLSGRLSPRAFRQYFFFRLFFSRVVRQLTAIGMQREDDAERMIRLGVDPQRISITGSLKHADGKGEGVHHRRTKEADFSLVGKEKRQVLVVGSTHRGEEEILLDVFLFLKSRFSGLLMVLAPRHPQRFDEVERLLEKKGVRYEKKSQMNGQESEFTDVIFLDTLGDLPAFYSVADIAFVGGSLVDAGGHNLMEPARFRKPILFGPHMTNFIDVAEEMKRKGGGIEVRGREDLVREIAGLLTDRGKAERMGGLAYGVVEGDRGVVERSISLVSRYLVQ
ncbi:MAG: 3-deoxy-D-manno-octulosonic acid transferase [Candidatus Binatia bacterium]